MAFNILASLTPEPERTRAELPKVLAEHYCKAGKRVRAARRAGR